MQTFKENADYMIHVFLEKTKDIQAPENSTVDPIFMIECMGIKKYSSVKKKIGGIGEQKWCEHIFLEPRKIDKREAEQAKIVIRLMDKGFLKDTLIGEFEFDLSFIYLQDNHLMLHKWLALNNPHSEGDSYKDINAYVKLSISVVTSGDEQLEIKEDDKQEDLTDVMMSPSLNPTFFQTTIRFFQAQDLLPMDQANLLNKSKIDAYITAFANDITFETKQITMIDGGKPIDFNTEFQIITQLPIKYQNIRLKLMDHDDVGKDENSGSIIVQTKDIIYNYGNMNGKFIWKNFWGSPLNQLASDYKTTMNENPEYASTWKGRILMQITCDRCEKPKSQNDIIKQAIIDQAKMKIQSPNTQKSYSVYDDKEYEVALRIGQAIALPSRNNYKFKVTIGGKYLFFKAYEQDKEPKKYKRFEDRMKDKDEKEERLEKVLKLPYNDIDEIQKVCFQLMDGDNPVCFFIDDINKYRTDRMTEEEKKSGPKVKWAQLVPDLCVGTVQEYYKSGLFSFQMQIHDKRQGPYNFQQYACWGQKKKRIMPVNVRVYIYSCKNLPIADDDGSSDPFVVVWDLDKNKKQTKIINNSTNPQFYEAIDIQIEVENDKQLSTFPPFILDVYDSDQNILGKEASHQFLGRAIIEATNCSIFIADDPKDKKIKSQQQEEKDQKMKIPQWHPIKFAPNEPQCGEILVRFEINSSFDTPFHPPNPQDLKLYKQVETKDMEINFLILGMRNLQSAGILPVKKAFVKFNIKSLLSHNNQVLKDVQTMPSSPGSNPTLNFIMNFNLELPVDPLYSPSLQCSVYDFILKGFAQPIIGQFVIPFGDVIKNLHLKRKQEIQNIENILSEIKELLENPDSLKPASYTTDINTTILQEGEEKKDDESKNDKILRLQKQLKSQYKNVIKGNQEFQEILGANEADGNNIAQYSSNQQLESIKQKQKELIINLQISKKQKSSLQKQDSNIQGSKDQKSKEELQKDFDEIEDCKKRFQKSERQRDLEQLLSCGIEGLKTILMPEYEEDQRLKIQREKINYPETLFIPLGWDKTVESQTKHYRKYFTDELENVKSIFSKKSPFDTYEIVRGKTRGSKNTGGLFSFKRKRKNLDEKNDQNTENVGIFKAVIEIESTEEKQKYERKKYQIIEILKSDLSKLYQLKFGKPWNIDTKDFDSPIKRKKFEIKSRKLHIDHLKIAENLAELDDLEILKKGLNTAQKCIIRIYMISAFDLSSRDLGSPSDPFLVLECNNQVINERENYQLDEPCPEFYKVYDFYGTFPGSTSMKIQIWDYDAIFGDELIGTTLIDLEDRFFSIEWNSLEEKPIEYRQLFHPQSSLSQGVVKCWVEIINQDDEQTTKKWDISPKPVEYFEVRICVFECRDFVVADFEGTTDAYLRGFFNPNEDVQETDTHFRCTDGKPDFQYRLVYKIKVPNKNGHIFTIQGYDRDFIKSNEILGEGQIDLQEIIRDCSIIQKPIILNKKYYEDVILPNNKNIKLQYDPDDQNRFWLSLIQKSRNGNIKMNGQVKIQIDILPYSQAQKNPVGKAREQNHSPFLPQPKGRIQLTMNPVKMLEQMIGPELKRKIFISLAAILCIIMCIAILPNILGALIVKIL